MDSAINNDCLSKCLTFFVVKHSKGESTNSIPYALSVQPSSLSGTDNIKPITLTADDKCIVLILVLFISLVLIRRDFCLRLAHYCRRPERDILNTRFEKSLTLSST